MEKSWDWISTGCGTTQAIGYTTGASARISGAACSTVSTSRRDSCCLALAPTNSANPKPAWKRQWHSRVGVAASMVGATFQAMGQQRRDFAAPRKLLWVYSRSVGLRYIGQTIAAHKMDEECMLWRADIYRLECPTGKGAYTGPNGRTAGDPGASGNVLAFVAKPLSNCPV